MFFKMRAECIREQKTSILVQILPLEWYDFVQINMTFLGLVLCSCKVEVISTIHGENE